MGDTADHDRDDLPSTAQPAPQPAPQHVEGGPSVHDLIVDDLATHGRPIAHTPRRGRAGRMLARLLRERRAFGLRKYGTVLQVDDPRRDPTQDLLEELGDALCYAYRVKAQGIPGGAEMYEALLALAGAAAQRWYWPDAAGDARPDFRGLTLAQLDDLRDQEAA